MTGEPDDLAEAAEFAGVDLVGRVSGLFVADHLDDAVRFEVFKRRKRTSMRKIANSMGVIHVTVLRVIDRGFVSNRIMEAAAEAIGKDKK